MRVICLTGGIGSGKSAAADFFIARGVRVVDTDKISHRLTAKDGAAMPEIAGAFGFQALDNTGAMNRAVMRELAFADPAARTRLEAILHPRILADANLEIERLAGDDGYSQSYILLAIPLLFERMTYRQNLWRTLVIDCAVALQVARAAKRSGVLAVDVMRVVKAQIPREVRLQLSDDLIWNGGDLLQLESSVDAQHRIYARPPTE
ncbi:MAG: dephospho-CoA kinase [Aeromicrobium sp.]|nr:dephospho-CoA kinase [Burkholderiales bacterium]